MEKDKDLRLKKLSVEYAKAMASEGIQIAVVLTDTASGLSKIFGNCCTTCAMDRYARYCELEGYHHNSVVDSIVSENKHGATSYLEKN